MKWTTPRPARAAARRSRRHTEANQQLDSGDQGGVENTAALGRLAKEGMKESNYLDAIMQSKYARHPDKLRGWESASHLEHAPVRAKKTPVPTQPPK